MVPILGSWVSTFWQRNYFLHWRFLTQEDIVGNMVLMFPLIKLLTFLCVKFFCRGLWYLSPVLCCFPQMEEWESETKLDFPFSDKINAFALLLKCLRIYY